LGCGNVNLTEIVNLLIEHGYQGDFEVRLIGPDIEAVSSRSLLTQSRRKFRDLVNLYQPTLA
jgi:hypothetical protein